MFNSYIFEKSFAEYENRILLIDEDHLETKMKYSTIFSANGFKIIKYSDDLSFRIKYEEKLKNSEDKLLVIAHIDDYIPYDIRRRFRTINISLSNLFPTLNTDVLREKSVPDLDLLSMIYRTNLDNREKRSHTEHFFKTKVYAKANVKNYLTQTLTKIKSFLNITTLDNEGFSMAETNLEYKESDVLDRYKIKYKDWFAIAEQKAQIDALAAEEGIEFDTSVINRQFEDYILTQFGQLSQVIDKDTPILLSRVMEYVREISEKFIIIIMDGMSEFDWNIISKSFKGVLYEKASVFAMIPTTTSISRQCLLSKKFPVQLEEPWKLSREKSEFTTCAKKLGYTVEQIGYDRGYDVKFSSLVRCGVIIINEIDELVHTQHQGRIGMFNDITVLKNQARLLDITKRFIKTGYDVYITSDHGNTPCIGLGKLMGTGVEMETKSRRMLVLKDFADKETLLERYGLIDYPKYYLMKDYDYLICKTGDSFDAKGEDVMSHGGITIDEVIVPFIKIKAVDKDG